MSLIRRIKHQTPHIDSGNTVIGERACVCVCVCVKDPDRRGLEHGDVRRHQISGRGQQGHGLLCLLHCAHALWQLYPFTQTSTLTKPSFAFVYQWHTRRCILTLVTAPNYEQAVLLSQFLVYGCNQSVSQQHFQRSCVMYMLQVL